MTAMPDNKCNFNTHTLPLFLITQSLKLLQISAGVKDDFTKNKIQMEMFVSLRDSAAAAKSVAEFNCMCVYVYHKIKVQPKCMYLL